MIKPKAANDSKTRFFRTIVQTLRAELSRQENAPMTCDGCERKFNMCEIAICEKCIRLQNRDDRYEPKGEKE